MTDLERFVRQIVRNLTATDPARLKQPLRLSEIRDQIIPYRTHRRTLELESSEDYELVLMRLCAGEGGFAHTEPEEVRAEFASELQTTNPDLTIIHRYEDATLRLEPKALARSDPKPELAFAPPEFRVQARRSEQPAERSNAEPQCSACKGLLPAGRAVNFCPHCGRSQALTQCPVCDTEIEAGWRHCVTCGYRINEG